MNFAILISTDNFQDMDKDKVTETDNNAGTDTDTDMDMDVDNLNGHNTKLTVLKASRLKYEKCWDRLVRGKLCCSPSQDPLNKAFSALMTLSL